ncbi:hypothetical protein ACFQ4K_32510 [Tistrella bauzanensis]
MAAESASGYAQWAGHQRGIRRALCVTLFFVVWVLVLTFSAHHRSMRRWWCCHRPSVAMGRASSPRRHR